MCNCEASPVRMPIVGETVTPASVYGVRET